ncbi:MAG: TonB C-terminal domain-containing protein [Campylobacteraceae bacterium]|jgi:protein TonB|nr:TonB C-terminal domain-containing protein [Campylobacteraceae bacterium]
MMIVEKRYYLTGFYISLILYATIFCALAYSISKSDILFQRFTSKKDVLDIILVEAPKEILTLSVSSTMTTTSQQKFASGPASAKTQTAGVQDLFKTIDETKLTQSGTKQSTPSRLNDQNSPQENASKILDKLEFKQQTLVVKGASSGIYDPFIGKIQDMLDEKWQDTIYTYSGAQAEVEIKIDKVGSFSYSIVTLSYNNEFNVKLKSFLDDMQKEHFPPYEGNGKFSMKTIFKDLME